MSKMIFVLVLKEYFQVDPWDSVMVPQMPYPLDYDTFVDYEEALLRWTLLCSSLPFLPPHATQLKELIPIQPVCIFFHLLLQSPLFWFSDHPILDCCTRACTREIK